MNRVIPRDVGRFKFARTESEYDVFLEDAKKIPATNAAIYYSSHYTQITRQLLLDSIQFCDSVLVEQLQSNFGSRDDFHTRVIQHLFNFLKGRSDSISKNEQMEAWDALLRQKGDSLNFVVNRFS